jgi:alginate O-acetyltransferase complex protein AlgJ
MAAGIAGSVLDRSFLRSPGRTGYLSGGWTAAWQAAYERALPLRDEATALWTLFRYSLFREGMPEVLVGSDGWLYSIEELKPPADLSVRLGEAVQRVADVRDVLAAKGIDLVVALVPTKTSVEDAHLGRYRIPAGLDRRYDEARRALESSGITVPDLRGPLHEAAAGADMYFHTDTHWTPQGARSAAAVLAEAVVPILERRHSTRTPFSTERGQRRQFVGDLLSFIPLGPWRNRGPAPDEVKEYVAASRDAPASAGERASGADLFAPLDIPVALVGTSYSANPVSGFRTALKDALDADVLSVAQEGRGPFAPMNAYLASSAVDDPRPDIVVWEIPERYLVPEPAAGLSPLQPGP